MTEAQLRCAFHPKRETTLRCNRCEKPICTQCALLTPVGYRCKSCVKGQQAIFETAGGRDFLIVFALAAIGVGLAVYLLKFLGFWGFLLAPAVGGGLAEVIRRAARRKRSRRLPFIVTFGGSLGLIPHLAPNLVDFFGWVTMGGNLADLGGLALSAIWPIAYGVLLISTLAYRIRGIVL